MYRWLCQLLRRLYVIIKSFLLFCHFISRRIFRVVPTFKFVNLWISFISHNCLHCLLVYNFKMCCFSILGQAVNNLHVWFRLNFLLWALSCTFLYSLSNYDNFLPCLCIYYLFTCQPAWICNILILRNW